MLVVERREWDGREASALQPVHDSGVDGHSLFRGDIGAILGRKGRGRRGRSRRGRGRRGRVRRGRVRSRKGKMGERQGGTDVNWISNGHNELNLNTNHI